MSEPMTPAEAIAALDVQDPVPVAWTSKDGTLRDDDGGTIDTRQTEPWVWALGPFGSWPETAAAARADINAHPEWRLGKSLRIGWCVTHKPGWGYGAKEPADG
jgi:hypothetical protein